ncbi:MAG: 5-oxoprolinase subunit PxpB [Rhodobacteraceae bacterium]|nr:MAG: 5-oxoprolinase subunit PxpB [Paracoccaceae bacterium]
MGHSGGATVADAARFLPAGDSGLVVEFGDAIDRAVSARVVRAAAAVEALAPEGVVAVTATFRSLLVRYDPRATCSARLVKAIGALPLDSGTGAATRRVWRLPTVYGGEGGPDLDAVAAEIDAATADVVRLHAGETYHVYMLGFLPGFAYMGDVAPPLRLPRLATPRVRLPAGSVAVALQMTAVYPFASPGGWRLLGWTPARLFDPAASSPALLAPGDGVRFDPVDRAEGDRIAAAVAEGAFTPEWTEEAAA